MFLFLGTPDPSLGRVDKSSFSQQTLMELFMNTITNREVIFGDMETDFPKWNGVCANSRGEVTTIYFSLFELQGSTSLQWLPPSLTRLNMANNLLTGTVSLDALPSELHYLDMSENSLSGSLNLESLSPTLTQVRFNDNCFSGSVCLTKLPSQLNTFMIQNNKLSGNLDLTCLPESLQAIMLSNNDFEGETDFSRLPVGLFSFDVSSNAKLSGTICFPWDNPSFHLSCTKVEKWLGMEKMEEYKNIFKI